MQLHFSHSMRSIMIASSNGFTDLKVKVAARHVSYRTVFHTVLILAFLLPFVFILTVVVTLEGVNKCSSIACFLVLAKMGFMEDCETSLLVLRGFDTDISSELNEY
ncbi:hypothetical protein L1987_32523 [Smallanthus sonchifolius]|uniref:Uncharacterized protein n=1 Tax=Smallanthus sonchifolius TaxID=185202 RepID=A0ACB9HPN7_9ASTR|nr:hypothetical protein L1987_32523 [Smallanthus sonchifolius]